MNDRMQNGFFLSHSFFYTHKRFIATIECSFIPLIVISSALNFVKINPREVELPRKKRIKVSKSILSLMINLSLDFLYRMNSEIKKAVSREMKLFNSDEKLEDLWEVWTRKRKKRFNCRIKSNFSFLKWKIFRCCYSWIIPTFSPPLQDSTIACLFAWNHPGKRKKSSKRKRQGIKINKRLDRKILCVIVTHNGVKFSIPRLSSLKLCFLEEKQV